MQTKPTKKKTATASINPRMIELARLARGLSQEELSTQIGCAQGTLSKIESGIKPADSFIVALSEALHFPVSFFSQSGGVYAPGMKYRRARRKLSAAVANRIDADNNIRARVIGQLLRSVEIENENIPSMPLEDYGKPEEVAKALREYWKLPRGPIANLTATFERNGGIVVPADFGTTKFDGVYYAFPALPPIVFLNRLRPADRMRFTLSHEIGHIVMHQLPVPPEEAEPQTDRFTSEFLMPKADIRSQLFNLTLARAAALKAQWRVSMSAIIRRAKDLQTITPNKYRSLMIEYRKECNGVEEPAETVFPHERPRMLHDLIEIHKNQLGYSISELSEAVHLNADEFEAKFAPRQHSAKIIRLDNARRWA